MRKSRWLAVAVASIAIWATSAGVASAHEQRTVSPRSIDNYHAITVLHSGKCLDEDISGSNAFRNGGIVQQWDCLNGTNQYWKFVPVGGGWYELHLRSSEKCLDIDVSSGRAQVNGAKAQQWDCNGAANQHFRLAGSNFSGYVTLVTQHSGKCLDEDISGDNGFKNGGRVQQWDCLGGSNQAWKIQP
jgi:hypothetical protein